MDNKLEINKIYNEDCIKTMGRMSDGFVDLIVTSPPYNMMTRVRNGKYASREKKEHFSKKYKHFNDGMSLPDFYDFHKKAITEMLRVSKVICYNIQIVTGSKEAFFKLIGDFNVYIKDIIVWDKGYGQPAMAENVLNSCYELILVMESDGIIGRQVKGAKFERGKMNDILRIKRERSVTKSHGAVFPEELASELITAFSSVGDIIYDPFAGSGTTIVSSIKLDRGFIASEISDDYCDIIHERIIPLINEK